MKRGELLKRLDYFIKEIEQSYTDFDEVFREVMNEGEENKEYDVGFYNALKMVKSWLE